ncbi:MAG: O-acetylhomoserine aminocarboxypropyltransferase/cysteine synthase [Ruminobacter sp.]|jgi:O-acetylhomoserine (thiol)-lyase|uniref:O-acetylhomoserine (Thiol)-lyase n=1 Tax=Ruminobacter amylophilus TaxID=867 RepID=A0A662ZJF5_9GAMM|nr:MULTISPECIES: O-acetylhomoserine aminocarboxypropyltransferase/cysteine synthase family protein [Ruminobacter]MBQ3776299.1 O-acetylhomoserine aminocarboxypropyltransferase/cysteine synthase [Ruminobacter sp.]SFP49066.1 O-acetylhomoserine (thiol)-lyase [Ruminobacter amylophilus]
MKDQTIQVHGGYTTEPTSHAVVPPIYQTVAYEFDNAQYAADLFNLVKPGNIYTRLMNPTADVLEKRMALLEGGKAAVAVASGQSAIEYALLNLAKNGNNIVSVPQLYGGTLTLLTSVFADLGIEGRLAKSDSPADIEALIDENTRAVYCETIGNPAANIVDISALAEVAHRHGVPLVVDNTVASPALCKPISFGADIVVHSLTKFCGGHGNTMGGIIVDSGRFDWKKYGSKFSQFTAPEKSYHGVVYCDSFGDVAYAARIRTVFLRNTGAILPPQSCFMILVGLETLSLRMKQHVSNTIAIAEFLKKHPKVAWVNSAHFPDSKYHELAVKYTKGSQSGLLTFGLKGGKEDGAKFYDSLRLFKRVVNIGDSRSCVTHPASTTHRQLNSEQLKNAGIGEELIRLTIGIEDPEDLIADIDQALAQI